MRRLFVIQLVGVMLAILAVGMATVFNVDIKWGSVIAIYSPNRTFIFIWNPDNLSETEIASGSHPWRWEEKKSSDSLQTNEIAITNRSNTSITCSFAFQSEGEFSDIEASVTTPATENAGVETNSFGIGTALNARGNTTDEKLKNLTRSGFVTLTGELSQSVTEFKTIGTISVTITEM